MFRATDAWEAEQGKESTDSVDGTQSFDAADDASVLLCLLLGPLAIEFVRTATVAVHRAKSLTSKAKRRIEAVVNVRRTES